jgi:hypothetical protein
MSAHWSEPTDEGEHAISALLTELLEQSRHDIAQLLEATYVDLDALLAETNLTD